MLVRNLNRTLYQFGRGSNCFYYPEPIFGKRARDSRPDSRENRASTMKTEMRALFNCNHGFVCTQKVRKNLWITLLSETDEHPRAFHMGVLPHTDPSSEFNRRISFRQNFQCRLILCKLILLIYVYNVYFLFLPTGRSQRTETAK